jgi:hypothetical protein
MLRKQPRKAKEYSSERKKNAVLPAAVIAFLELVLIAALQTDVTVRISRKNALLHI